MRRQFLGSCAPENVFTLVDPSTFSEIAFEKEVVVALNCLFPEYHCIPFAGKFFLEEQAHRADLALIHKEFSHWFVIEVELESHSLDGHVLPQVRTFRFGEYSPCAITSLCRGAPWIDRSRAESLLKYVPLSVAVVVNRENERWKSVLNGLNVHMLTLSILQSVEGCRVHQLDGTLEVAQENLGFFTYEAAIRGFRIPLTARLPSGALQIRDQFGSLGGWFVSETAEAKWMIRKTGDPGFLNGAVVQLLRMIDGGLALREPRK